MLAEPKTKRRADGSPVDVMGFGHMMGSAPSRTLGYGDLSAGSVDATSMQRQTLLSAGLASMGGMSDYSLANLGLASGLAPAGLGGLNSYGLNDMNHLSDMQVGGVLVLVWWYPQAACPEPHKPRMPTTSLGHAGVVARVCRRARPPAGRLARVTVAQQRQLAATPEAAPVPRRAQGACAYEHTPMSVSPSVCLSVCLSVSLSHAHSLYL
jgi:hypothetical protein